MTRFILRRILVSVPLVWALATLTFFLIRLAPGDPVAMYYDPEISPEVMEAVRTRLGLDQPLHIQYWNDTPNSPRARERSQRPY